MRFKDSAELYWPFRKNQITARVETEILGHVYMIRYNPDEEGKKKACLAAGELARDDRFPNFTYTNAATFSQLIMGIEWTNRVRWANYHYK